MFQNPVEALPCHAASSEATETVMLDVSGMKCGGCSASVKRILLSNEGVQHAAVNLLTETAVIKLRPAEGSADKAAELLTTKVMLCNAHGTSCPMVMVPRCTHADTMHAFVCLLSMPCKLSSTRAIVWRLAPMNKGGAGKLVVLEAMR